MRKQHESTKKGRANAVIVASLVVIIVASAFLSLDFKAATSNTQTQFLWVTYPWGNPKPGVDPSNALYLYVDGQGAVAQQLKSILTEILQEHGVQVIDASGLERNYDRQALVVALLDDEYSWNPFFASALDNEISWNPFLPSAQLRLLFLYSSSGNMTYFDAFKGGERDVHIGPHAGDELLMRGVLDLRDSTIGIVSLKAFQSHLTQAIADIIVPKLFSLS